MARQAEGGSERFALLGSLGTASMANHEPKARLSQTGWIGFPILVLLLVVSVVLEGRTGSSLLVKLIPQAALYGLIAFSIAMWVAACSSRWIVGGDILRILCWTVVGAAEGFREMGMGYYALGFPQYVRPIDACTLGVIAASLTAIIVSRAMWPPPPEESGQPRCERCGYLLTGLKSPRCPECGVPFDDSQLEDDRHDDAATRE